jgi:hypothetical protein
MTRYNSPNSFIWGFDNDWYIEGFYGSPDLRQSPDMTIFKALRDKKLEKSILTDAPFVLRLGRKVLLKN